MRSKEAQATKRIRLDRSWLEDGAGGDDHVAPELPTCNLKKSMPCCGGRGFVIGVAGAYAHASLCACVTGCQACLGLARQVDGNSSKPCQKPPPNVVANLINAAMIPARYAEASLARFRNFTGNGRTVTSELTEWRRGFVANARAGGRGVILEGPVGVGKTYLLAALAKDLAAAGLSVRFTDFFQLLGELKSGFSQGKADAAQLAPLIEVDVLVIDELGKGRNNDFELTILDQLVCGRYNQGKTLLASTNYHLKGRGYDYNIELDRDQGTSSGAFADGRFNNLEQRIGPRIFSRLREMTSFLELTGDDCRRLKDGASG